MNKTIEKLKSKETNEIKFVKYLQELEKIELECKTCNAKIIKRKDKVLKEDFKMICECKKRKERKERKEKLDVLYEKEGYEILEDSCETVTKPLKTIHKKCGYIWDLVPAHFIHSGSRCPKCANSGFVRTKEEIVEELKKIKGGQYELVEGYKNATKKATFKHKVCGKNFEMSMALLRNGTNCPHCFGTPKKTTEVYKKEIMEKFGEEYVVLEEYKTNKIKIKHKHICGKESFFRPDILLQKRTKCKCLINTSTSKEEKEIIDFIKANYSGTVKENDRETLFFLELDIYLPELKLAVEFDGFYWHSEEKKGTNYHLKKTEACEEKGIKLIHIFEDEWTLKKEITKAKILKEINLKNEIEDFEVIEITDNSFEKENSLVFFKEETNFNIAAIKETKAIAVLSIFESKKQMVFTEHRDFKVKNAITKLIEFAIKKNKQTKEFELVVDRRWSNKIEIEKEGLMFSHSTDPNFFYFEKQKRIQEKTEKNEQRVFDCGNHIFKYTLSSKTENE